MQETPKSRIRLKLFLFSMLKKMPLSLFWIKFTRWATKVVSLFYVLPPTVTFQKIKINNIKVELITQKTLDKRYILYIHGGGFLIGINGLYRCFVSQMALDLQAHCFMVDYDLLPDNCFPKALDQCIDVYKSILDRNIPPERLIIMGDSAGGNLALSMLIALKVQGYPLAEKLILLSPWLDMSLSGESLKTKKDTDPLLAPHTLMLLVQAYCGGISPTTCLVSPLFADLKMLPPTFISVGTQEVLLDDSLRFVQRAREAEVEVELHVGKGMMHIYPVLLPELSESKKTIQNLYTFVCHSKRAS